MDSVGKHLGRHLKKQYNRKEKEEMTKKEKERTVMPMAELR